MDLRKRWFDLCQELNILNEAEFFSIIVEHYTQEYREYHGLYHLNWLFQTLDELKEVGLKINYPAISLAIFLHDMVHALVASDNEDLSAQFLKKIRFQKPDEKFLHLVHSMVMASKHKGTSRNYSVRIFMDMDYSILGANWKDYCEHAENIRLEYRQYLNNGFLEGRLSALDKFLKKDRKIFLTRFFHERCEKRAKRNITAEKKRFKTLNQA